MLLWGIAHIAENHGFNSCTDYEEDGQVCVWGGCNVPTISDVRMLCEDVHIAGNCIFTNDFGVDIELTDGWMKKYANKTYKGMSLWKSVNA